MRGWHCPEGHGALIPLENALYCPHRAHEGRPKTHPEGEAPASRAFFRYDEATPAAGRTRRGS